MTTTLQQWLEMPTHEVLEKFANIDGAYVIGEGDKQSVYIPGTRKQKVLLVAHADTVFDDDERKVVFNKKTGIYSSAVKGVGIGADDRAGIAILWQLRNMGHSILVPNSEESGCLGSNFLMSQGDWGKEINEEHQFAIEFDRMGDDDLVFYSTGSQAFLDWLKEHYKGYSKAGGSFTDISVLCTTMCGVNVSIGYHNQHRKHETLVFHQWKRTLDLSKKLLSLEEIPRFTIDHDYGSYRSMRGTCSTTNLFANVDDFGEYNEPSITTVTQALVLCPNPECGFILDKFEAQQNNKRCVDCNTPLTDD